MDITIKQALEVIARELNRVAAEADSHAPSVYLQPNWVEVTTCGSPKREWVTGNLTLEIETHRSVVHSQA